MPHSTNLVMISGPSGSGKDSVIEGLVKRGLPIERIVTTVSRDMREGEQESKPYYFVSPEKFDQLIKENKMAEWAVIFGKKCGTTKKELARVKKQKGKIGIWKTDWQGVVSAKKLIPDILVIFILPPDVETLADRLAKRGRETREQIAKRLSQKEWEQYSNLYDYEIINEEDKLEQTIDKVINILKQERYINN